MKKLILLTLFGCSWSAAGQVICGEILGTRPFMEYVEAIVPHDLTPEKMQDAGKIVHDEFLRFVFTHDDTLRAGITSGEARDILDTAFRHFNYALNFEVKGWFKSRDKQLQKLAESLDRLLRSPVPMNKLVELTVRMARHPQVEDVLVLAEFFTQKNESLVHIFLLSLYHEPSRTLSFGPREMALAREALQYAHLSHGDQVLQLGVASPTALTAMRHYQRSVEFRGLSVPAPNEAALYWAGLFGVSLSEGEFGDPNLNLPPRTFRMILALDGLGTKAQALAGPEQLSKLKHLLVPHGSVVLIFDYDQAPDFTEIEARELGFQIVSWRRPRHLDSDLADVVYGPSRVPEAGRLHAYVLRLGDEDTDQRPPKINDVTVPVRR